MTVKGSEISVVVQGHVKGGPDDPYEARWTLQSLESVRRHLPDAQLILSTFKSCDVSGLPYDTLVLSDDPGPLDLGTLNRMLTHTNRQIVSTRAGLAAAEGTHALKMRYDLVLHGVDFIDYFGRFNERQPMWRIFTQRIVGSTSISLDPRKVCTIPFAPSDWFHFGLCEDVRNLWDITLIPGIAESSAHRNGGLPNHRYTAEQHIWVTFLRKHGPVSLAHANDCNEDNIVQSELTIVNNLVLLEHDQLPITCLKYADLNHNTYSKVFNYSYSQWLQMYQQYCLDKYEQSGSRTWTHLPPEDGSAGDSLDNRFWDELLIFLAREGGRIQLPDIPLLRTGNRAAWPGSDERCLAVLGKAFQPRLVVEVSQGDGASALTLKSSLPSGSFLFTVRYQPTALDREYCIAQEDMADGVLCSISMDVSLPEIRRDLAIRMTDADMVVFNIDDGRLLSDLLHDLRQCRNSQTPQWVVIQQIRNWSVASVWHGLDGPKLDLTTFGSCLGLGIVKV